MKCPKCGSDVSGNFCINCGSKLILTPSQQSNKATAKINPRWIIAGILVAISLGAVQTNVISFIFLLFSAFIVSPISDKVSFFKNVFSKYKPLRIVLPILFLLIAVYIDVDKPKPDTTDDSKPAVTEQVEITTTNSTTVTNVKTTATTTLHKTTTKKTTTKAATTAARTTTTKTTSKTTAATVQATTTQDVTQPPTAVQKKYIHFILNTDTNCIHKDKWCRAATSILPENYAEIDLSEDELETYIGVYWACGICSKLYEKTLPKP